MSRKPLIYNGMSLLITLVLLLCAALPVLGSGDDPEFTDAVFTVGSDDGEAGDKGIEIPVTVVDCPPFVGLGLQFTYDTSALTLTGIAAGEKAAGGTLVTNIEGGILNFDWFPDNQFQDGEVFVLTFDISEEAFTGDYPIGIALSDAGWANEAEQELTGTFEAGCISVTGTNGVALYGGVQYETLQGAIDAAAQSSGPGMVKILDEITIETFNNRILIPDGAEITLDMNGHTITSKVPVPQYYVPVWTVEVEGGAALNLVSSSGIRGKFEHATCPEGSVFLLNGGTLNMSDVDVGNFYYGVFDGEKKSGVDWAGTYGTFEDCDFTTRHRTFYFGKGSVEAIKGCRIEVTGPPEDAQSPNWLGVNMAFHIAGGEWVNGEHVGWATLGLLENTCIEVNDAQDAIQVSGRIEAIKNCTIVNNDEPYEVEEYGETRTVWPTSLYVGVGPDSGVGTITDTSFTGTLDCMGTIDLIEGDDTLVTLPQSEVSLWNWHTVTVNANQNNPAYIGAITGGTFEGAPGMTLVVGNHGGIGEISGGKFTVDQGDPNNYYPVWVAGGDIGTISGGLFDGGKKTALANQGTIEEISGAKFISTAKTALNNSSGTITTISGGEFASGSSFALNNTGTVSTISGGNFTSNGSYALYNNVGQIGTISGGTFVGPEKNGIYNYGGTIESISGGAFQGNTSAIWNSNKDENVAEINSLSGGYYKNTTNKNWINGLNLDCQKPQGYDFATVSLRPQDLPQWFPEKLENAAGFYHFGETVDVTWEVEGNVYKTDKFVNGDPVYYSYAVPESDAGAFRGWSDGVDVYGPEAELPPATVNITYEAQFAPLAEDYLVSLVAGRNNINAGEEFTVDVVISSDYNEDFYGATIEVSYDSTVVDYKSAQLPAGFGLVKNDDILKIVGASSSGYKMDENSSYEIGTLTFQAKSNVSTGEALFSIEDNPVVNQEDAVYDQVVPKGDDLSLNLWNLQVTFGAGNNVTMEQAVAYVKYNQAGLWTSTAYSTAFTEPLPVAYDHYTLDDPLWKPGSGINVTFAAIQGTSFTENAVYTVNASPSKYEISYPESVDITSGVAAEKVTYLTDVKFTVTPDPGYRVKQVAYTAGGGGPVVLQGDEGTYTIPGNKVTGDIVITVEQVVDGTINFISNDDFYALPTGYQVLLLTVDGKLSEGAYEYDGNVMFYSSAYSEDGEHVYVYVVPADVDLDAALELLEISDVGACVELSYDGDVNLDQRYNSTDAVLIYGLYKGVHATDSNFTKVSMRMRLEADVNGDGYVNTADAQKVLNKIWGIL